MLGGGVAAAAGTGFVLARKPASARARLLVQYQRSTGSMPARAGDALAPGARVLVHDGLLATAHSGGALRAGGRRRQVAVPFVIELASSRAREEEVSRYDVRSLVARMKVSSKRSSPRRGGGLGAQRPYVSARWWRGGGGGCGGGRSGWTKVMRSRRAGRPAGEQPRRREPPGGCAAHEVAGRRSSGSCTSAFRLRPERGGGGNTGRGAHGFACGAGRIGAFSAPRDGARLQGYRQPEAGG